MTRKACAYFQCGTAAGMGWETDGNSAGRWCGFPNFHCSASQAPGDVSCGS